MYSSIWWGYETLRQSIASAPPWVTQNISEAHMNQVKKSKENLTAPKILQHMADVEEDLRTSTLPSDPSVGGTSPLPCSSIWELPGSLLFPNAGHSTAAGQPSKQTSNFCKMCLDVSHINHECCSLLWIQQLPIGINRKPFYPRRTKKGEGVMTVNCVSGFWAGSMSHKQIGLLFFLRGGTRMLGFSFWAGSLT